VEGLLIMSAAEPLEVNDLQCLLIRRAPRLREHVSSLLTPALSDVLSADDIMQDVWIAAFRGRQAVRGNDPRRLNAWLNTIADRKVLDAIRTARTLRRGGGREQVKRSVERTSLDELVSIVGSPSRSPSGQASAREASVAVRVALGSLPDRNREAISLRYLRGLPLAQVAQRMNTTENAVRGLVFRGLHEMRQRLGHAREFFSDAPTTTLECE
jgi:RNA polymerase sigma-70 factor (ECF subfamily)